MSAKAACPVCCEAFTIQVRKRTECIYCAYAACASCVQQYLLASTQDAHCMSCRNGWNREFLGTALCKSFVNGQYKLHREQVLLDREKALLPDSQLMLENYRVATQLERLVVSNENEMRDLRRRINDLTWDVQRDRDQIHRIRVSGYANDGDPHGEGRGARERRQFVRACPADGCRGFLSSQWKCGTCELFVCNACHEIKGEDRDAPHTCDPDVAASAALLARDTKPCPKCASMIYKIDGCDQMWCTQCQTAFSWRSGAVVTNAVHNPHYYEWLRRLNNGGEIPREPGDAPGGPCAAHLPGAWDIGRHIRANGDETQYGRLMEVHRLVRHLQDTVLRRLRGRFRAEDNADLRLQYLLQNIDEVEWRRKLQQREKKREKDLAVRQVYEMFVAVATDSLVAIMNAERADVTDATLKAVADIKALLAYANANLRDIGNRFGMRADHLLAESSFWKAAV
jgi:hypothetical protein